MNNKFKDFFTEHIGLKLLAIVLAVLIWLVVINVDDYAVTKRIKDVPVEVINGESIENLDKVYDITSGDKVDIVVKGRRSIVDGLTARDFRATADLSQLSITNTVKINIVCVNGIYNDSVSISCANDMMTLSIEDKIEKQVKLDVIANGVPAEGYAVGICTATPNIVTISGPKSVIEQINEIRAVVDVNGLTKSFEKEVEPAVYNIYGESMANKNVEIDVEKVTVNVPINPTKLVDVKVKTEGEVRQGYVLTDVNYHPQQIKIAGSPEILDTIKEITIDGLIVTGVNENKEYNIDINDYLPEGVYLAEGSSRVAISLTVKPMIEVKLDVTSGDIYVINGNEIYDYKIIVPEGYQITVTGLEENVSNLSLFDLNPTVDVSDLSPGTYHIDFYIKESDRYKVSGIIKIEVQVTEKVVEDETEDTSDTEALDTTEAETETASE